MTKIEMMLVRVMNFAIANVKHQKYIYIMIVYWGGLIVVWKCLQVYLMIVLEIWYKMSSVTNVYSWMSYLGQFFITVIWYNNWIVFI